MQYWTWAIPRIYAEYIAELKQQKHPLYDELIKLRQSETGTLRYTFEIYPNTFLLRIYRHRVIYERMLQERQLILASIEQS